jgi:predicted secreted protein
MYSEDKSALRKTLSGVVNNIRTFVEKGFSSDDIIVAVIQDGLTKVDQSVIEFFS